jgi:hypothetical protein
VCGQTRVVRAEVGVVGDAVAVIVSGAGVGRAAGVRPARLVGTEVVRIRDAVAVLVGAAAGLRAWLIETLVIHIANSVAVGVYYIHEPWAAIVLKRARFVGAIVLAVAHPIAIGIGATLSHRRASFIGAVVFTVKDAVTVLVFTGARRTAIAPGSPGGAWFFRAGIHAIGDGIPIRIGAALGHRWAGLVRALVCVVRDAV